MNVWLQKAGLLLLVVSVFGAAAYAQEESRVHVHGPACLTPSAPFDGHYYIPPPEKAQRYLDLLEVNPNARTTTTITVNYLTGGTVFGLACDPWSAPAMAAFDYAASIWEALLESTPDIEVNACWTDDFGAGSSILGGAGAVSLDAGFAGSVPSTWYQQALANAIAGSDLNGGTAEIQAAFNSLFTWYFGTDGATPGGSQDFVTVVLHELGHGLGFSGSGDYNDGSPPAAPDCGGTVGFGCIGAGVGQTGDPYIYDRFTEDLAGAALLAHTNPSAGLGLDLTGGSGSVFFDGTAVTAANGTRPTMYSPGTWAQGSSYSHFDIGVFPSELMKHALSAGSAIHSPGLALDLFEDLGWTTKIPVELTLFTATTNGQDISLNWETASETNNAGFEVMLKGPNDEAYSAMGFVDGHGTTTEAQSYAFRFDELDPGTYLFRLHQIDFDGQSELLPEVEATVEVPGSHMLAAPYPNPFNPTAMVEFAVTDDRPVRLELFNMLGQRVSVLFDGVADAGQTTQVQIDGTNLPSGAYLVRLSGENILVTQRVTLLK